MELSILDFIQQNMRSGFMDAVMVFVTHLGDLGAIWAVVGIICLFKREWRPTGIALLLGLALAFVVTSLVLKPLVARPRPCDIETGVQLLVSRPSGWSFPSGHAAASFAAVSVLFFRKNRWWPAALVLALAIAFSRLYLFVHFPTDVIAGALVGILCGWLAFVLAPRLEKLAERAVARIRRNPASMKGAQR